MQLALLLTGGGACFVVVGSTARLLHGATRRPKDLDVVVTHADAERFESVLRHFTSGDRRIRPGSAASPRRVVTSWSPVDVFLEDDLPAWHTVEVDGTRLRVADE